MHLVGGGCEIRTQYSPSSSSVSGCNCNCSSGEIINNVSWFFRRGESTMRHQIHSSHRQTFGLCSCRLSFLKFTERIKFGMLITLLAASLTQAESEAFNKDNKRRKSTVFPRSFPEKFLFGCTWCDRNWDVDWKCFSSPTRNSLGHVSPHSTSFFHFDV